MAPISFKANFVKNTYIKQVVAPNTHKDKEVAIVELDVRQENDMSALKTVARDWDKRASGGYAGCIYSDATANYRSPYAREYFFALTTQKDNFKNLDPKQILGLTLYSDKKFAKNEINWLQVEPDSCYKPLNNNRQYKNIGKALVEFIKEISDQTILVYPARKAKSFYRKLGFEKETSKYSTMVFKK